MLRFVFAAVGFLVFVCPAFAEISGEKDVFLVDADGAETQIGTVVFRPSGKKSQFEFKFDDGKFTVNFLNMRNFHCYETDKQKACYLPYPYKTRKLISKDDLTDLEYELLFIRVLPDDYGINAWNGVYYDLKVNDDGSIGGLLMDADLNVLAVPPEDDYARPILEGEMSAGNPGKHQFPSIIIK